MDEQRCKCGATMNSLVYDAEWFTRYYYCSACGRVLAKEDSPLWGGGIPIEDWYEPDSLKDSSE